MPVRIARFLLVALTLLGLLLPGVSAAIALAAPGSQTVIICTGDGLKTITIDADGKSGVETHRDSHCLLAHAVDICEPVTAGYPLTVPFASVTGALVDQFALSEHGSARPRPRAPPLTPGA